MPECMSEIERESCDASVLWKIGSWIHESLHWLSSGKNKQETKNTWKDTVVGDNTENRKLLNLPLTILFIACGLLFYVCGL